MVHPGHRMYHTMPHIGDKREHTQIIPETEYIALTDNNYVPLTQAQISLCAKIG